MLEGLLNVWQLLAQALHGASRERCWMRVAQPVACRQAALAACCPSRDPKDAISSRPYSMYSNARKVLVREEGQISVGKWSICKSSRDRILLAWSETWEGQAVHTHLCNTAGSKLSFEIAMQSCWLIGDLKAAIQMRKLNPDLAANLLQVVEMSLVVVPPSPSWYPSCSELLHSARGSPSVTPSPWSLTSQNPHVPCRQCALLVSWGE